MKKKVKVSIIVPVYNVEKYIERCLISLINQTLDSYEIIVVNDESPDNSQQIIDTYVKKYPNKIKSYIKNNGGPGDARNYGVKKATGEYIGFVDSDDCINENMFELMYEKGKKENSDVVVCDYATFDEGSIQNKNIFNNLDKFPNNVENEPTILFDCKPYIWNKIYKRKWYVKNNFSFPINQWFEDDAVIYNILYSANKISSLDEVLYYYYNTNNSSITNTISMKIFDIFKATQSIFDFYQSHTTKKEVLDVAERLCQIHIFVRLNFLIKKSTDKKLMIKFYKKANKFFNQHFPKWSKNPYYKQVSKKNIYLRIRHIPWLMYIYFLTPKKFKSFVKLITKKKSRQRKRSKNYISKDRLRQLQLIELDILKEIDKVCKDNNITYYLGEGTLLGAIRHKGFIPWDDDLDIVMPRKDYIKFLEIADKKLSSKYELLNEHKDDNYYLPFSKVISLDKHGFINNLDKFSNNYSGPYVDIFPLDYVDTINKKKVERKYRKIRKIRDMLLFKVDYFKPNTKKRILYKIESNYYSNKKLYDKLNKIIINTDSSNKYMCNFASSYHPKKQLVPKEVYGKPKYIQFEDTLFPVPNDSDKLLTIIYGDYMKLPPIQQRKSKHGFYDEVSAYNIVETKKQEDEEMDMLLEQEMSQLHNIELSILKEIDKICKKHKINYYLGEGSMLGAIRHHGFIPWDDDIDLLMKRNDYEKFLKIAPKEISKNYEIQHSSLIDNYWSPFIKVRYLKKCNFKQKHIEHLTDHNGPLIDIFPLDNVPKKNSLKQFMQAFTIKLNRGMLSYKLRLRQPKKIKGYIVKFLSNFVSVNRIHKTLNKTFIKYNNKNNKYIVNLGSYYSYKKQTHPKNWYGKPRIVSFEKNKYPIPKEAEKILSSVYGNYMELPPKNKRIIKHHFE